MAARLAGGNGALALLCNTLPTGAILAVLILIFGPLSGAHFNPAVSLAFAVRGELAWPVTGFYIVAQVVGGLIGVWVAHLMFELPLWQVSTTIRTGLAQWLAEAVATFGLGLTILGCATRARDDPFCGRPLHHVGLLVHGVDVVCQSGGDHCPRTFRHVCRDRALQGGGLRLGTARRDIRGSRSQRFAVAS
jgi:glycerol uptake facilitator-like aquaporin